VASFAWILGLSALLVAGTGEQAMESDDLVVLDFRQEVEWFPVHDGVMGGVSSGNFQSTEGKGVFSGVLSLENNGGFASVRFQPTANDLSAFGSLVLRIRGDGRSYQLRLRASRRFDGVAYRAEFDTRSDEWLELTLPLSEFEPTFRGRKVPEAGPLDTSRIEQITLMIADKKPGPYRLEIEWVRAR
jgi:monofunctional biosynthetic peptidoglycan transglycosylase